MSSGGVRHEEDFLPGPYGCFYNANKLHGWPEFARRAAALNQIASYIYINCKHTTLIKNISTSSLFYINMHIDFISFVMTLTFGDYYNMPIVRTYVGLLVFLFYK